MNKKGCEWDVSMKDAFRLKTRKVVGSDRSEQKKEGKFEKGGSQAFGLTSTRNLGELETKGLIGGGNGTGKGAISEEIRSRPSAHRI